MNVSQLLAEAIRHHQDGRLTEAEARYRKILAQDPKHCDALQLLGVIAHQSGHHAAAVDLIRRAIALRPGIAEYHNNLGQALEQLGQVAAAEAEYRRAITLKPSYPEAHNNLGNVLRTQSKLAEAISAFRQAIKLRANYPEAHSNLGNALQDTGSPAEAITAYETALQLNPGIAHVWVNLGTAFQATKQNDRAEDCYRRALQSAPTLAAGHNNLGLLLQKTNRHAESAAAFRAAIQVQPDHAEAYNNLGLALKHLDQLDHAARAFETALHFRPNYPQAHNNLGLLLKSRGKYPAAIQALLNAIQHQPDYGDAHNNLGVVLLDVGQTSEAIEALETAIRLKPDATDSLINLANALERAGRPEQAIEACQAALAIDPRAAGAHHNWAHALKRLGQLDDAIHHFRRAIELNPTSSSLHSNLLFTLHYHPDFDSSRLAEEHRIWRDRHASPLRAEIQPHANDRSPERRLRIGYVSPDLRTHAIARFLLPLIQNHNRERFELFFYSDAARSDAITEQFRAQANAWRDVVGLSDSNLCRRIREDKIDILLDLAAHTAGNRMFVFARRPAPVQATYLAYAGSTGLDAIDYRFTDRYLDPNADDLKTYAEESVFLPDSYWCCQQPFAEVNTLPPPMLRQGWVTFGCLNNFSKISDSTWNVWAELLREVPGSRLVVHSMPGSHRTRIRQWLESENIDPNRISFVGVQEIAGYLGTYNQIDVALDPFPYGGGTTTCDAFWMGVPVITLPGRTAVSRAGSSLLSNLGLAEFIARDPADYVRLAADLAGNPERLAALRATLRARMETSPLMNAPRFAAAVESAYYTMWRRWALAPR